MEREIQTMRIYFLEEFQSADNARSIFLNFTRYNPKAYTGGFIQEFIIFLIFLIFTLRDITQFDIRLHHYTACVYSMGREMQTHAD